MFVLTSSISYDFAASKSGAIIIPSCGYDSIPSDVSAYLSNKTLKSMPSPLNVGSSVTAHKVRGGISGGTISTMMTVFEDVPRKNFRQSTTDYSISPGPPSS